MIDVGQQQFTLITRTIPHHFNKYLERVSEREMNMYLDEKQVKKPEVQNVVMGGPVNLLAYFSERIQVNLQWYVNERLREELEKERSRRKYIVLYSALNTSSGQYFRGQEPDATTMPKVWLFEDEFFRQVYELHNDLLKQVGGKTF